MSKKYLKHQLKGEKEVNSMKNKKFLRNLRNGRRSFLNGLNLKITDTSNGWPVAGANENAKIALAESIKSHDLYLEALKTLNDAIADYNSHLKTFPYNVIGYYFLGFRPWKTGRNKRKHKENIKK